MTAARRTTPPNPLDVGRRERQIVEIVYRLGRASVSEVLEALPNPPTYSTVRAMLGKLRDKGHLTQEVDWPRYLYRPAVPAERAVHLGSGLTSFCSAECLTTNSQQQERKLAG